MDCLLTLAEIVYICLAQVIMDGDVELLSICHVLLNSDKYLLCQTFRSMHVRTITACKIGSTFSFLLIRTCPCKFPS